jgi:predicted RNA-binding Zn ribbon-like protein
LQADVSVMVQKSIEAIRILGGHPALDLINTVDARRDRWGPDALASYGDLMTWAARTALLTEAEAADLRALAQGAPEAAQRALRRALAGRELLYAVFIAEARETVLDQADADRLAAIASIAAEQRRFHWEDGHFEWRWRREDLDTVLNRVLFAATALLTNPERRRVRECTARNCGWLFLDSSKSGSRRWCSEAGCGIRERVRRARAKPVA